MYDPDQLPDVCRPFHGGDEMSEEANESIHESKQALRAKVLVYISQAGDATCDEVEAALHMRHQTCSARITELRDEQLIARTGLRRRTRSGRFAHVYRAVPMEPEQQLLFGAER